MHEDAERGVYKPLTRVQDVRDHLSEVGSAPEPTKFIRLDLNNVFEECQVSVQRILGREKLPDWDRMWADLQQEEMRRDLVKSTISGRSSSARMKQVKVKNG